MKNIICIVGMPVVFMMFLSQNSYADQIDFDKLVEAVIQVESGGRMDATNGKCVGIAQVSPIAYADIKNRATFNYSVSTGTTRDICRIDKNCTWEMVKTDPYWNWFVARTYLYILNEKYDCKTIEQICAGYNMGPTALKKINYDMAKAPASVKAYIRKVTGEYRK